MVQFWWGGCQNGPWAVGVPGGIRDRRVIVDVSWVLLRAIAGSDQEVKSRSVATSEGRTFSVRCHSHVCCPLRNRARVRLQTRPSAACGRTPLMPLSLKQLKQLGHYGTENVCLFLSLHRGCY